MTATTTTRENFPAGVPEDAIKQERDLKLKAGAITSTYEGSEETGWTLTSVWNVIGEQ